MPMPKILVNEIAAKGLINWIAIIPLPNPITLKK
jgi:hypothetical protein